LAAPDIELTSSPQENAD